MSQIIRSGLVNYYGEVELFQHQGSWYLGLENYDGRRYLQVSETFAEAFKQEFQEPKTLLEEEDLPNATRTPEDALWHDFIHPVGD